ncbi:hypothetical protein BDV96DRAFT_603488 [Lophiotrema nucula]|uniref:Uncharacterized protein n=1 Tax=Lophiotrema nucula TaxID=690887 RepID=A0A6A5YVG4_9PLEO|nr:hypothetical protein BDV96DRAFT_603488 [Lophiotrema nucula]
MAIIDIPNIRAPTMQRAKVIAVTLSTGLLILVILYSAFLSHSPTARNAASGGPAEEKDVDPSEGKLLISDYDFGRGFRDICGLAYDSNKANRVYLYNGTCFAPPLNRVKSGTIYHVCDCTFYSESECTEPLKAPLVEVLGEGNHMRELKVRTAGVKWYSCFKPPGT